MIIFYLALLHELHYVSCDGGKLVWLFLILNITFNFISILLYCHLDRE